MADGAKIRRAQHLAKKKMPDKPTTFRTPEGADKQLDYVLIHRKGLRYSRNAEANDMIHMGSDRTLYFLPQKKARRPNQYKSAENTSETAHVLDQDNKKQNSEKNTKFEEQNTEREKRVMMKRCTRGKNKRRQEGKS